MQNVSKSIKKNEFRSILCIPWLLNACHPPFFTKQMKDYYQIKIMNHNKCHNFNLIIENF